MTVQDDVAVSVGEVHLAHRSTKHIITCKHQISNSCVEFTREMKMLNRHQ